jgi:peptidyl-prolyl cis-trans isomerase NIMA-interacting 1
MFVFHCQPQLKIFPRSCAAGLSSLVRPPQKQLTNSTVQADTGLPPNWEVRHSNSKNLPYYFNASEKVSRWEPPPGTDTEKLKHYMATHHSASATATKPQAVDVPAGKIRAAHLLVKHKESRRPSSWREVCSRLSPTPAWASVTSETKADADRK